MRRVLVMMNVGLTLLRHATMEAAAEYTVVPLEKFLVAVVAGSAVALAGSAVALAGSAVALALAALFPAVARHAVDMDPDFDLVVVGAPYRSFPVPSIAGSSRHDGACGTGHVLLRWVTAAPSSAGTHIVSARSDLLSP
jgi:hypothetical protein